MQNPHTPTERLDIADTCANLAGGYSASPNQLLYCVKSMRDHAVREEDDKRVSLLTALTVALDAYFKEMTAPLDGIDMKPAPGSVGPNCTIDALYAASKARHDKLDELADHIESVFNDMMVNLSKGEMTMWAMLFDQHLTPFLS